MPTRRATAQTRFGRASGGTAIGSSAPSTATSRSINSLSGRSPGICFPSATLEQKIATAFHRNTMTNTEGGTDDEEFRVAAIKDRVDTTMQVWMGLTMGCAKCHSHKFDPITHEEYYKFYAIFNQTADNDQPDESPVLAAPHGEHFRRDRADRCSLGRPAKRAGDSHSQGSAAAQAKWEESLSSASSAARKGVPKDVLNVVDVPAEQADEAAGRAARAAFRIDRAGAQAAARQDRRAREKPSGDSVAYR